MTGVVVVTHAALGEAIRHEAENILGRTLPVVTVAVSYRTEIEATLKNLRETFTRSADAQGILVITDLPGATPHNLASQAAQAMGFPVVSGLNLPMLLKVTNHADKPPAELAELAVIGGTQGIVRS